MVVLSKVARCNLALVATLLAFASLFGTRQLLLGRWHVSPELAASSKGLPAAVPDCAQTGSGAVDAIGNLPFPNVLASPTAAGRILVTYVYAGTSPTLIGNLQFFLRNGVFYSPDVDFIIVFQGGREQVPTSLPEPLPNVRYVNHANECYDLGTYGWVYNRTDLVQWRAYTHFLMINSSIRGPFLPVYLPSGTRLWIDAFLSQLDNTTKLVGCTINCWIQPVHVQSFLLATDQVGLQILHDGGVLSCHKNRDDAVAKGELGASTAIVNAGYNLGSLLKRYKGLDWRDGPNGMAQKHCTPDAIHFDPTHLDPLEVLFVKLQPWLEKTSGYQQALKYTEWEEQLSMTVTKQGGPRLGQLLAHNSTEMPA